MDTDMLAAMEDLLDTWPGPLIVVSHDRYLLERVTDTQYAVLDGAVRHVPGGVEQYLQLRRDGEGSRAPGPSGAGRATSAQAGPRTGPAQVTGAQAHAARKELAATERRMDRLSTQMESLHGRLAAHDQADYVGLQDLTEELRGVEAENERSEERWLELSELLT